MAIEDFWNRLIGPVQGALQPNFGRGQVNGRVGATVTNNATGRSRQRPVTVYGPDGRPIVNLNAAAARARLNQGLGIAGVLSSLASPLLTYTSRYARDALDLLRINRQGLNKTERQLERYGFKPGEHALQRNNGPFSPLQVVPRFAPFQVPDRNVSPGPNEPGHIRADGKVFVNPDLGYQNRSTANQVVGQKIYPETPLGQMARLKGKPVVYEITPDGSPGWVPTTEAIFAAAQRRNARQSGGSSNNSPPPSRRPPEGGGGQNNGGSGSASAPPPTNLDRVSPPAAPPAGEQQEAIGVPPTSFDPVATVFSGQFPDLVRDPLKMNAAATAARRYQAQMNNLVSLLGSEDQVRRLAFETQAPTVFKIDNDKEVKPKLSDYYQAQQLIGQQIFNQNSTSLDQVIKELGYNDDLKTWALANPALAQREYAKMLKQQGSSIPAIPAIPSSAQNIAGQTAPIGGQIVVDPNRFYNQPYNGTTEKLIDLRTNA